MRRRGRSPGWDSTSSTWSWRRTGAVLGVLSQHLPVILDEAAAVDAHEMSGAACDDCGGGTRAGEPHSSRCFADAGYTHAVGSSGADRRCVGRSAGHRRRAGGAHEGGDGASRDLVIFELDHPATQELKLRRLAHHGLDPGANTHYVAADLRVEGLDHALKRVPFDRATPAFFSWLGVTPYLTRETNLATLRSIATSGAAGSEIVFNYLDQESFDSSASGDEATLREFFASLGEPWVSGFHPTQLAGDLNAVGLQLLENFGQHALRDRYCAAREDGLEPFAGEYLALARVVA